MPVSQETAARADHPVDTEIYDKQAYEPGERVSSSPTPLDDNIVSSSSNHGLQASSSIDGTAAGHPNMPSETVRPGIADTATQQGATQPGSGTAVPASAAGAAGGAPPHHPSFKEKVVGYAKKTRGATLGNTETKEQGERILAGQEKFEPKKFGPGAKKQKERTGSL